MGLATSLETHIFRGLFSKSLLFKVETSVTMYAVFATRGSYFLHTVPADRISKYITVGIMKAK